jgi:glycosyltransferase involved in cell wall biosynthesis
MKIGVIAHLKYPIREPFAGGLEMHTYALCDGLHRRGHKVTLFAAAGSAANLGLDEICDATGSGTGGFRQEHRIYLKLMENLRTKDLDVIHNNSLHYLPPALAGGLRMPMVTVLHTPPFWEMEGSIKQNGSSNSRFVAVSSFIRDIWTPITPVDQIIHNGIDLRKFSFAQVPAETPYVVWSGRIVPEKGLHLAVLAARLAGITLRIAGPVSDHDYFERAIRPNLNEQADYVGHLSQSDLAALIRGARAFLFTPLWDEPYGLVLAEALACGTPVASFARGAVTEILDETCGITVPPDDITALVQAAHKVQALHRADCRKRAEAIADSGRMIEQYEALYRRLVLARRPLPYRPSAMQRGFPEVASPRALLSHYDSSLPVIASEIPLGLRQ